MEVLLEKFEAIGYRGDIRQWHYYNHNCFNVIFRQGRARDGETWIVAHHDYCAGKGAEDNATALSVMIETARAIRDLNIPVAFASFDLEERGLLGAWEHAMSLSKKYLHRRIKQLIDLECLGSGKDLLLIEQGSRIQSDPILNDRIECAAKALGIKIIKADCSLSYADHVPFALQGIPVTQIFSADHKKLLACEDDFEHARDIGLINHSKNDVPKNIHPRHLLNTTQILTEFFRSLSPKFSTILQDNAPRRRGKRCNQRRPRRK